MADPLLLRAHTGELINPADAVSAALPHVTVADADKPAARAGIGAASASDLLGVAQDTLTALGGKLDTQIADLGTSVDTSKAAVLSFRIGLGTASMPAPSGDAPSDISRFATERAKGTRYIEHQDGTYLHDGSQIDMSANQRLIGHGSGRTTWLLANQIPAGTSRAAMFQWLDAAGNDVGLDGITVDAGDYAEPFAFWAPVVLRGPVGLRLHDLNIVRFPRFGLVVNAGSGLVYEGGKLIRSTSPKDSTGAAIAAGQQSQAILTSESAGACIGFRFSDIYAKGAGHDASGSYFTWERCEVDGFNFGCGFVLEQAATCHHHRFIDCSAHGGRGTDSNNTTAGGFELWGASAHQVVRARSYDNDGYALTLGAPGSLVRDCSWEDIGRVATAAGVGLSNGVSGSYSAAGSTLRGNRYVPATGNSNWSVAQPITWGATADALAVEVADTVSGFAPSGFPGTTLWTGKGAVVTGHTSAYSGLSGPAVSPINVFLAGIRRALHKVDPVTFVGDDGSALPAGLAVYADVDADNDIKFWIANVDRSANSITFPAGTFTGRIVSR